MEDFTSNFHRKQEKYYNFFIGNDKKGALLPYRGAIGLQSHIKVGILLVAVGCYSLLLLLIQLVSTIPRPSKIIPQGSCKS